MARRRQPRPSTSVACSVAPPTQHPPHHVLSRHLCPAAILVRDHRPPPRERRPGRTTTASHRGRTPPFPEQRRPLLAATVWGTPAPLRPRRASLLLRLSFPLTPYETLAEKNEEV